MVKMGGVLLENNNGEQSFLMLDGCGKIMLRLAHGVDQVSAEKKSIDLFI